MGSLYSPLGAPGVDPLGKMTQMQTLWPGDLKSKNWNGPTLTENSSALTLIDQRRT